MSRLYLTYSLFKEYNQRSLKQLYMSKRSEQIHTNSEIIELRQNFEKLKNRYQSNVGIQAVIANILQIIELTEEDDIEMADLKDMLLSCLEKAEVNPAIRTQLINLIMLNEIFEVYSEENPFSHYLSDHYELRSLRTNLANVLNEDQIKTIFRFMRKDNNTLRVGEIGQDIKFREAIHLYIKKQYIPSINTYLMKLRPIGLNWKIISSGQEYTLKIIDSES